jgi:hypothetical protein
LLKIWKNLPKFAKTTKSGKKRETSCSLLGAGVEAGLAPNIMKDINILMENVIKEFSYNYDRIIQEL